MARHRSTSHRRPNGAILGWTLAVLLLVALAVCAALGLQLATQARQVREHETRALAMLDGLSDEPSAEGFGALKANLARVQRETRRAAAITDGFVWKLASKAPFVGGDVEAVRGMASVVDALAHDAAPRFVAVLDELRQADLAVDGGVNLQPVLDVRDDLTAADDALRRQIARYEALPEPSVGMVRDVYEQGADKLGDVGARVGALANAVRVLPGLLGSDGARTYAVAAMTTSEMRSSGGLIGSLGVMRADGGRLSAGDFRPTGDYLAYGAAEHSEDVHRIFVDEGPLHMSLDLRDLGVSPDTGSVARAVRSVWDRAPWNAHTRLDGVVTVDPVFVQELIAICGDVTLHDGVVLTGSDAAEFLLNTVYLSYPIERQDALFGEVAEQALSGMFRDVDVARLVAVGALMDEMAAHRHFNVHSFHEDQERDLRAAGFTASAPDDETRPSVGVYLNEQSPSKMGWYVRRSTRVEDRGIGADGDRTYHVEYTLDNTMTPREASELTWYVTGNIPSNAGKAIEKILFYPPAGGSISNIELTGGEGSAVRDDELDGRRMKVATLTLAAGERATYAFDVTTSPKAQAALRVDQTPMGWRDPSVIMEDGGPR